MWLQESEGEEAAESRVALTSPGSTRAATRQCRIRLHEVSRCPVLNSRSPGWTLAAHTAQLCVCLHGDHQETMQAAAFTRACLDMAHDWQQCPSAISACLHRPAFSTAGSRPSWATLSDLARLDMPWDLRGKVRFQDSLTSEDLPSNGKVAEPTQGRLPTTQASAPAAGSQGATPDRQAKSRCQQV